MIIDIKNLGKVQESWFGLCVFIDNTVSGGVDTFLRLLLPRLSLSSGPLILFVNSTFPGLQDFSERIGDSATIVTYTSRLSIDTSKRRKKLLLPTVTEKSRGLVRRLFEYCYLPFEVARFRRQIRLKCRVPALMVNGGYPGSYAVLAASIALGKTHPVLLNVHNLAVSRSLVSVPFDRVIDRFVRERVRRFVSVSEVCKQLLDDRLMLDSETSVVVYNAIESRIRSSPKQIAGEETPKSRAFVLGLVGTIEERKGHTFALSMFKILIEQNPEIDFSLRIVGSDPMSMTNHLKTMACKLGIDHRVEFVGYKSGRKQIYEGIDLLLVPSTKSESFGFVAIEGLAEGIPVVASSTGALSEILERIPGCSVIDTWNVNQWTETIVSQVYQKPSEAELTKSAKYLRFTDPDQMASEYAHLLSILGRPT